MPVLDSTSERQAVYVEQMRQFKAGGKQPFYRAAVNRDEKLKAAEMRRYVERITVGYRASSASPGSAQAAPQARVCDRCGHKVRARVRPYKSIYTAHGREDCYRCDSCSGRA